MYEITFLKDRFHVIEICEFRFHATSSDQKRNHLSAPYGCRAVYVSKGWSVLSRIASGLSRFSIGKNGYGSFRCPSCRERIASDCIFSAPRADNSIRAAASHRGSSRTSTSCHDINAASLSSGPAELVRVLPHSQCTAFASPSEPGKRRVKGLIFGSPDRTTLDRG